MSVPEAMRRPGGVLWEQKLHPAVPPTTAGSAPSPAFRPPPLAVAAPGAGGAERGRGKMAAGGAADAQARFGHSVKGLLTEKVTSCGTDVIALTKQVLKGSRSAEVSGGYRRVADCRAGAEPGGGRAPQCKLGAVVRGGDTCSCLGRNGDSGMGPGCGHGWALLGTPVAGGRVTASSPGCLRRSRWMCSHGTGVIPAPCYPSCHGGFGKSKAAASQPGLSVYLLAPGSSCEKHGDARRCHLALGRCELCSCARAAVFLGTGGEEGGKNSLQPCCRSPGVKYMTSGSRAGGLNNLVLPQIQCHCTPGVLQAVQSSSCALSDRKLEGLWAETKHLCLCLSLGKERGVCRC